jgi:hypothetical protein
MTDMAKWIDVGRVGLILGRYQHEGARGFAVIDTTGEHGERLGRLGFQPARSVGGEMTEGIYVGFSLDLKPKAWGEEFGREAVRIIDMEPEEVAERFDAALMMRRLAASKRLFDEAKPVGLNYAGLKVWESAQGRFFRMNRVDGSEMVVLEGSRGSDGRTRRESHAAGFLYVDRVADLRQVTDGFVRRMAQGERLTVKDFNEMIELSRSAATTDSISRRDFQESVEGSMVRFFARYAKTHLGHDERWRMALRLYENMPAQNERTSNSVANQQFSTPLPISLLGQRLLGDIAGKKGLEPTIGNRSLVSVLPKETEVYGVEIDPKRLEVYGAETTDAQVTAIEGDAAKINFRDAFGVAEGFDFTIANPPFGSLDHAVKMPVDSPLVRAMETQRLDHQILYRTLAARKDRGQSVFIVGADEALGYGAVKGRTEYLLNYLRAHYEVEGVADIAGNLYRKMGAAFPIRMLVIGDRKEHPATVAHDETNLLVLKTHEEVYAWVEDIVAARAARAGAVLDEEALPGDAAPGSVVVDSGVEAEAVADVAQAQPQPQPEIAPPVADETTAEATEDDDDLEGSVIDSVVRAKPESETDDAVDTLLAESEQEDPSLAQDEFQRGYEPFSRVGEATTMIPVNLASPVYAALAAIQKRHGDIDEYVAKELEYGVDELGGFFSPEQVDAIALAIAAKDNGKAFLDADQMGVGKGRVIAAMARHARLNHEIPVFVTVKSNLFSDFLERDLVDIRSRDLFKRPFILNDLTKIVDRSGAVSHKSPRPAEYSRCYESGMLPQGTDIVFLTYSQLSRPEERSKRVKLIQDLAMHHNLSFLLDESHNGAGDSYTSDNLCKAIENNACPVLYSSGTPIKGAKNLRLYSQILPRGVNYEELLAVIQKDPISLQEALNHEIALSGCLISRELDNRAVVKEFAMSAHTERNRILSDQVSSILMDMSYIAGDMTNLLKERKSDIKKLLKALPEEERKGSRLDVSSMNFGSRFHAISRQFLLAIKADQCVDEAIAAIERNEKPIIALQHTGESLLTAAVANANAGFGGDGEAAATIARDVVLDRPVSFKDLLHRYLQKITWIKETSHYGEVKFVKADSKEMEKACDAIAKNVNELPDELSLTPIDYFKHRLGLRGYKVGEVSGRGLAARYLDNGGVAIEVVNNTDKSKVIRTIKEFNNGECDAIVLTASGSTGVSLQASPANGRDLRQRVMIKWEPQQDIAVERQMDGRHNRTGQVVPPKYKVLLSGLPADDRQAMMFNNKNRSLTSSTTANRDSKELIKNVPDLLNEVGDMVAEEMFYENPSLADIMDVELASEKDEADGDFHARPNNFFINRMTGRIMLLKYDDQVKLYEELGRRFAEKIDELNAIGENPLVVKCYPWNARVVSREVFLGEASEEKKEVKSQFDEPVYLTTVSFDRAMTPLRAADVDARIANGREMVLRHDNVGPDGSFREFKEIIRANYTPWLQSSVSVFKFKTGTIEEALGAEEANQTKSLKWKLEWLSSVVMHVAPGNTLILTEDNGEEVPYVIVGTSLPKTAEDVKRLGEWGVYAVRPGFDEVESMSMNKLYTQKAQVTGLTFAKDEFVREAFDNSPSGLVEVTETLLDGNIFEAVATSIRGHLGRKIVYTDESGMRRHGVLVKRGKTLEALKRDTAERVRNATEIIWYLDAQHKKGRGFEGITTSTEGKVSAPDAIRVARTEDGEYLIQTPGTKSGGGHIFLDPRIAKIEGNPESKRGFGLEFEGSRSTMRAYVDSRRIEEILDFMMREKGVWFYTADKELLKVARAEMRADAEKEQGQQLAVA